MKKILLSVLLLGLLLLAGGATWGYYILQQPVTHNHANGYLTIPKGSSTQEIVQRLAQAGVVTAPRTFLLYLKLSGAGSSLQAGDYRLPSPISPLELVTRLQNGQQKALRLTIIEGWTRWDVAQAMSRLPELRITPTESLKLMDDTRAIRDLDPQAPNLEGYLYPDTYFLTPEMTPQQVISLMVERTRRALTPELNALRQQRKLSVRQLLTVAALIETEAKLNEERPLVASVIYNRLARDISLGIDSTVIYASKLAGKWKNDGKVYQSDLDRESPYNTRRVKGLPPGPIASPSAASLNAAVRPAQTDYLYYVRNPDRNDGAHNFYSQESEFAKGVQALRDWEKAQAAAGKR